jgi:hypothetical protein
LPEDKSKILIRTSGHRLVMSQTPKARRGRTGEPGAYRRLSRLKSRYFLRLLSGLVQPDNFIQLVLSGIALICETFGRRVQSI